MKIAINKCFGGFGLSDFACEKLGCRTYDYDDMISRTDEKLINLIETYGSVRCNGKHAAIVIVEIPNEATDWEIGDYDGIETVAYVVNGKIHHA